MSTKLVKGVIHWKKKLERTSDEGVILEVIHKLSKVPMTVEILQETLIGKCIRNLSERNGIVGEKASALLKKWRNVFANKNNTSVAKKVKVISVRNPMESKRKCSNETDTFEMKSIKNYQEAVIKETGIKNENNSSHSYQSLENCRSSNRCGNSSEEFSLHSYEKTENPSMCNSYNFHTDVAERYNIECSDLFPSDQSGKWKSDAKVERYGTSLKRKLKEEANSESKYKNLKSTNSNYIFERKEEKKSDHVDRDKIYSEKEHFSNVKEGKKEKSKNDLKEKKSKGSCENEKKCNKSKLKLKLNSTEEFTSSDVRFEDCLGFNDVIIKRTKSSKSNYQSVPKKAVPVKCKPPRSRSPSSTVTKQSLEEKMHFVSAKPLSKSEKTDIISTMPQTLLNRTPAPRIDTLPKKKAVLTNEDAMLYMSSKREKTTVYSGRRTFNVEIPTLFECATRVLVENADAIECLGGVPYYLLKPFLEKCTPVQLYNIENFNPYLLDDTHELWEVHCKRDYKLLKPQKYETYRELYLRAHEEREKKLKSLTANISASMSKYNPARQVKLAYIDTVAKPPREVARMQAKNSTALPVHHPIKADLSRNTTSKSVTPDINSAPGTSESTVLVPKKPTVAPLMAKTLKSMKQCFNRK